MRGKRRNDRAYLMIAEGYRLATAEILYRLPDHPALLQTYVWQDYDLPPAYPALKKFLAFWRDNLDGPQRHRSREAIWQWPRRRVRFRARLGRHHRRR